jgi:hypothetical protein
MAYKAMQAQVKASCGKLGVVKTTKPVTIEPGNTVVFSGLCHATIPSLSESVLVDYSNTNALPGGLVLTPTLVTVNTTSASKVPVKISNLSGKAVTIPMKTILGELHQVKVASGNSMDDSPDDVPQPQVDLSEKELSPSQLQTVWELLHKWSDVFASGPTDLGHTRLVKHRIRLTNDTPFKERHRRIPPGVYNELREYLEGLNATGCPLA